MSAPRAPVRLGGAADPRRRRARRLAARAAAVPALAGALLLAGAEREAAAAPADAPLSMDLVIVLDVSRSMLARDVAPSRLGRARAEIRALAERARTDRLALVAFAGEARRLVPVTRDGVLVADSADAAGPDSVALGGTDLAAALDAAFDSLPDDGASRSAAVLLLTDGEDLAGEGAAAAARLAARGVPVHAFGLGDERGSKITVEGPDGETFLRDRAGREVISGLDARSLEAVAAAGGGEFVRLDGEPGGLAAHYATRILPQARRALADLDPPARALPAALLSLAFLAWILVLATRDARTR